MSRIRGSLLVVTIVIVPGVALAQAPCTSITVSRYPDSLEAASAQFLKQGGLAGAYVTASTPDCTWTAAASVSWLTFPDGATGAGSRWLIYSAAPNTSGASRSGGITVAANQSRTIGVSQSAEGVDLHGPIGQIQSPAGWTASPSTSVLAQPFRVTGYSLDTRATSGPGVTGVDIYWVDNTGLHLIGPATYGRPHPHVAEVFGSEFLNTGFEFDVSGVPLNTIPPGAGVSIQAYARSGVDGSTIAAGGTRVSLIDPRVTVAPTTLQFGASVAGGSVSTVTPMQSITLSGFAWNSTWSATTTDPWIQMSATSGTGPGILSVSVNASLLPGSGALFGAVRISVPDVPGGQVDVPVRADFYAASATAPPSGAFDAPPSPTSGALPLTGWALDDVGIARVDIYRLRVPSEVGSGLVFIGNGNFVDGARPDVAAAFPSAPEKTRAGWGYMLLSNVLPDGGNGTFTFLAFAIDVEGRQTLIGSRDIALSNATAYIPFGALDVPGPGATLTGTVSFGGWTVNPYPGQIRSIILMLDGQPIGFAEYGVARPDVSALFVGAKPPMDAAAPGFRFTIDTTGLANGHHTIAFLALTNDGRIAGLGSRFFTVKNP